MEMERIAEDGNAQPLMDAFEASDASGVQTLVVNSGEVPVYAPGEGRRVTLMLDPMNPNHRYLSFASMVIPSNDAFIGNDNPTAFPIFNESGELVFNGVLTMGSMIYDAGTEVNDETPENTPLLMQSVPNTGMDENGSVMMHPGFLPADQGRILSNAMFSAADFTVEDYSQFEMNWMSVPFILSLVRMEDQLHLDWIGGLPPFRIQSTSILEPTDWAYTDELLELTEATIAISGEGQFYRIQSMGGTESESMARYRVDFTAAWSAETHPMNFPASNPHFSGLIGSTHNASFSMWSMDSLATPGIESMAETGSKLLLNSEIMQAIEAGTADRVLSGGGIGNSPGSVSLEFEINSSHPLVSLVSMIAPSPDWFVGVHDLSLLNEGSWVDEMVVDLFPYDSGSDSGTAYTSSNVDTVPKEIITRIQGIPFLNNGNVAPLGTFTFTKL